MLSLDARYAALPAACQMLRGHVPPRAIDDSHLPPTHVPTSWLVQQKWLVVARSPAALLFYAR